MKNKLIELIIVVIFLSLLIVPNTISLEIISALKIFAFVLFPSIFPFFLISDLLISYNFPITLNKYLNEITEKIFHVSNCASFVILMSMVSGFPSGVKYIKNLYDKNMINLNDANYLITFTHFANPLFIITVTKNIFVDIKSSYVILGCMYLSNLLIGIIIRPKKLENNNKIKMEPIKTPSFSECLENSINSSISLLAIILGNTCFFFVISKLITSNIHNNYILSIFINGFFDLTKGINSLQNINSNLIFKGILILSFVSFGGININMQIKNIINGTPIKYSNFLLGRISQIAISILLFLLCSKCIIIS